MNARAEKIHRGLTDLGLDAIFVFSPENFAYVTGFSSHQHTVSRQPHFACAAMMKDSEVPITLIGMDFESPSYPSEGFRSLPFSTWVGNRTLEQLYEKSLERPFLTMFDRLEEIVNEMGIYTGAIGIELDFVNVEFFGKLKTLFPDVKFVNVSPLFLEARIIKTDDEIVFMKELIRISDEALAYTSQFVKEGVSEKFLFDTYCEHVIQSHVAFPSGWSSFTAGEQAGKLGRSNDRIITSKDVVKFDGGVHGDTRFYTTDFSRSWLMGNVDPLLVRLKHRLMEAHELMLQAARPGLSFKDWFDLGFLFVKQEFPFYTRGHLGHSISMGPQTAEAPYISPNQDGVLQPGMILSVENPMYITGYNGFNIEDMILITEDGMELLTPLTPHWLDSEAKYR